MPLRILWLSLFLLVSSGLAATDPLLDGLPEQVVERFKQLQSGPIRILYHEVDTGMARRIAGALEVSRRRLADELDMRELPRASIVIAFDKEHFYRMSGGSTPHWAGAVTVSGRRLIVFRSQRWGDVGGDLGSTVRHELTHLGLSALHRGQWIPTWLEEGVAVVLSGLPRGLAPDGGGLSLSKALSTGSLLDLDDLESLNGFSGDRVGLAYQEAESAVRFFLERYGRVSLIHTLTLVGRGVAFREAFDQATGGGWFRFEEEWREWLDDQQGLYFLVDIDSWIWGLILMLGLVAFTVRHLRSRAILKRWQQEETREADWSEWGELRRKNPPPPDDEHLP